MTAVTLRNIWKEYGDNVVLERIDLDVEPHSFVALVGPSGCGKSTLLRMLMSAEVPTRGEILIEGEPLPADPTAERGVVFQRYSVFPHLTVEENVLLGLELQTSRLSCKLFGGAKRTAMDQARSMLEEVGLGHALKQYPSALSGGMQQRLAIAQALIMRPKVLLLDEPFGALDPGIRAEIHVLMRRLWQETKMTVFMVTHDLSEAFHLGTRVIALEKDRTRPEELERYGAVIKHDLDVWPPKLSDLEAHETVDSEATDDI